MPVDPPPLDPSAIFAILDAHHVKYVVVGGYAAQLHGSSRPTTDIDLTPQRSTTNLQRLARALGDLEAGIRVDNLEHGLPFNTSAEALAGMKTLNLRTRTAISTLPSNQTAPAATCTGDQPVRAGHPHVAVLQARSGRRPDLPRSGNRHWGHAG